MAAVDKDLLTKILGCYRYERGQSHVLVNSESHFAISTFTLPVFKFLRKMVYFKFSESLFLV